MLTTSFIFHIYNFQAIFFSTAIFTSAGLSIQDSQSATLGMGGMNVAMTIISLILIEKAGRKTLMLSGLSVMLICTTCILICLVVEVRIMINRVSNQNLQRGFFIIVLKSEDYMESNNVFFFADQGCVVPFHHLCYFVCGWICYRTRFHSLVFCERAFSAICQTNGSFNGSCCQLDSKLFGWTMFPTNASKLRLNGGNID